MNRERAKRPFNTTLDKKLLLELKLLAVKNNVKINELIEDGMKYIIEKYKEDYQ